MKITTKFATYRTTGYTHQVGDDARATGGVHHHQIRKGANGYLVRIAETNGRFVAYGKTTAATKEQVAAAEAAR